MKVPINATEVVFKRSRQVAIPARVVNEIIVAGDVAPSGPRGDSCSTNSIRIGLRALPDMFGRDLESAGAEAANRADS